MSIIYAFGVELLPFLTQKGQKNQCIFTCIEGSPLWIVCGKIVDVKFFENFKKKSKKWPIQDLFDIERNKLMKNQPIWGIRLAYDNQSGGVFLTPLPCRIGLRKSFSVTHSDILS